MMGEGIMIIKKNIKRLLYPYIQHAIDRDEKRGKFSLNPLLWG